MLMLKILNTTTTSASTTNSNSSLILSTTVFSALLTADWSLLSTELSKKTINYKNMPTKAVNLTTESTTIHFTTTVYTTTGWVAPSSTSTSTTTFKPLQKGRPEGSGKEISSKKSNKFVYISELYTHWLENSSRI